MRKIILLSILLIALLLFSGCGKGDPNEIDLVVNTITDLKSYTIVRSENASPVIKEAASDLCTAFYKKTGAEVKVTTDSSKERAKEIIIGETLRSEAIGDEKKLGFDEYYINMIGTKIYILGGSERAVAEGVDFVIEYLIVENSLKAPTDDGYRGESTEIYNSIEIDGNPISDYTIVADLYDISAAEELAEAISSVGCTLEVVAAEDFDLDSGKYILLKDTNTDFSSHSVTVENGNVIFFANYVTIHDCVDYFISDMLMFDVEKNEIKGPRDLNISEKMNKTFKLEHTPVYTKEKLLNVLGEVYEDNDRLIIAQQTYGGSGKTVENERSRYLKNCGVDVPMIGFDIVATKKTTLNQRFKDLYDFVQFAREGGIATFSIHLTNPVDPSKGYRGAIGGAKEWDDLFTEGTAVNEAFMNQLKEIGDYLEVLHNNGMPVIFRPLHEMNGNWFWFCITNGETGERLPREYAKKFWIYIYDYLVIERGITSMLWEYSPNVDSSSSDLMYCYPGDEYCDLVACDWYTSSYTGHNLLSIASNTLSETKKIFSLAEFGPTGNILTDFAVSKEYKFTCSSLDDLITEIRDDNIKMAYLLLWHSSNENKMSMWNMGEAELFYENDVYLTLEDTYKLLYD